MSTNHNRIRVADLETNQPNKILKTNAKGELEFSDANNLQTENYNALDCTTEGKSLDARQGKVLKDMIDNANTNLSSKEDVSNKSTNIQNDSSSNIKYPSVKAVFNWVLSNFRLKGQNITQAPSNTYTLQLNDINETIVFSSDLPSTFIIPTQDNVAFETGHTVKFIQTGSGPVTLSGTGITFMTNQSLSSTKGETRTLTRLGKNYWSIEGHVSLEKDINLKSYSSSRNDGQLFNNKVLSTDENGNLKLYTINLNNDVKDVPVDLASDAETQISAAVPEDKKVVSRLKLFNWWGWIKSQTQTISGMWNFTNKVTLAVSTSNTPALIIPNGTLTTTAQNGAIERDSSGKLWTTRLGTRYQILENDGSVISLISNAPQSNSDESFSLNSVKERTINTLPIGTFHNFIVSKFTYLGNYYTSNGYGATSMKIDIILRITNGVFCNSTWGGSSFKDIILFTYSGNSNSSINSNIMITGHNNGNTTAQNGAQSEINGVQIRTADNSNQMFLKDASFVILERKTITFADPTNSLGTNQNVRFLSYTTASYIEKIR